MSDEIEARIRKVEDFQEITNFQARYSFLIDERNMEALLDLFSDPFVWEAGFERMTTVTSPPEFLQLLNSAAEAATMWRHQATNP